MFAGEVGRGDKFKFWEDSWIGEETHLLEKYPRLHSISLQQDQFIQQMGDVKDSGWEWDFKWRRPLFDSEIDLAVSFLEDIQGHRIRANSADQWVWVADPSGQYTVRSAYTVLREDLIMRP